MATGALISVEEYLAADHYPDRDYIDGVLVERNMGEQSHGRVQLRIGAWLYARESRLRIRGLVEVRLRINPQRFRVPDVMVLPIDAPREEIVRTPPLLCVEILSRSDSLDSIWDRIEDYFGIGVPVCWIIDPVGRRGWIATPNHLDKVTDSIVRAGDIEMPLAEVLE